MHEVYKIGSQKAKKLSILLLDNKMWANKKDLGFVAKNPKGDFECFSRRACVMQA